MVSSAEVLSDEPGVRVFADEHNGVPTIYATDGNETQLVYFLRGYTFHPGTKPTTTLATKDYPLDGRPNGKTIHVVDTGWVTGWPMGNGKKSDLDWFELHGFEESTDIVRGHGPAIVDLINQCTGSTGHVKLHRLDYGAGVLGGPTIFPTDSGDDYVRGFDARALEATLVKVYDAVGPGDIVCLSLGTVTGNPEDLSDDPVAAQLREIRNKFSDDEGKVRFVVAAGNHSDSTPSWPAAYSTGADMAEPIPGVIAVGSIDSGGRHDYSAYGTWVTADEDGKDVPVQRRQAARDTGWSGTSFAAPIHAARLLMEVDSQAPIRSGAGRAPGRAQMPEVEMLDEAIIDPRSNSGAIIDLPKGGAAKLLETVKGLAARIRPTKR